MSIKKIVITGPESTGKSTLCAALAAAYQTVWVPEYAREYIENLGRPYNEADLLQIAKGQMQAEDEIEAQAKTILICDTDLYTIKIWSEHKYNRCHAWILEEIARRKYDLYLLANIDIPWTPDAQREHPEPEMRTYFYNAYRDTVIQSGMSWYDISGTSEERLKKAMTAIDSIYKL